MNGHSPHASKSPWFQPENAAGAWPTSSTPRDSPAIELVNGFFDRVVRPTVSPGNRKWNSYRLWQCVGFAVGAAAILTFTAVKGLSLPVGAALILVSIL